MKVGCEVDKNRRTDIRRNHTVTHLLHRALREVLGDQAEQKGSYVAPDRMRFDFQHSHSMSADEKAKVEELVNRFVLENHEVRTEVLPIAEAKKRGAMALFGEKYGDTVRMVTVDDVSTELCGGTHLSQTAPIGTFRIVSEESVSAGVRRIEGVTGMAAGRLAASQHYILSALSRELKVAAEELPDRIRALLDESRSMRKELAALKADQVKGQLEEIATTPVKDAKLAVINLGGVTGKELKDAADIVKRKIGDDGIAVLAGSDDGKVSLVVTVGSALAPKRLKAGDIVQQLAPMVGGGGGGRPDMAQAGGKEPEKLEAMLAAAPGVVEQLLQ
jgi:alanyl-tRNA synthetase